MTHNGAPQICSKFLNQGRVLSQCNSSSLRHQSQSTQAPSSPFLLEGGFVERLVMFGSLTKSTSPHCNFGISRAITKWAAVHLHHDDTLQITVHRGRMEVSTQVDQLFETVQVDSSNLSSSIQRLVENDFQFCGCSRLDQCGHTSKITRQAIAPTVPSLVATLRFPNLSLTSRIVSVLCW
jgi:hypothetical protein